VREASEKPIVIAIVGPTASGKTALSLATAEQLNAEIIACDSRTIYRHFDIGTAKPSAEEQARIRHHLIDVADPDENFTAANFAEQGAQAIEQIRTHGKMPVVCGGTGFYSRALLEGLSIPPVAPDEELRAQLRDLADREGNDALWQKLHSADPAAAAKLGVNDRFRIIRALEVIESTGKPFTEVAQRVDPPYRVIWVGLTAEDRSKLHASIRLRFYEQMDAGMMEETERLYGLYGRSQKMMNTVNYRQLVQLIEGEIDRPTAEEEAIRHNVQLARRQLMWFRANPAVRWFAIDKMEKAQLHEAVAIYINECIRDPRRLDFPTAASGADLD
jgi:tRNA dimethylallyltransferase